MHSFNENGHPNGRERLFETRASVYELDLSEVCVEDFLMTLLTE